MPRITKWIKKETLELIPPVIYFAIYFNLFHFAQSLMMQPEDIHFTSYLGATIGALLAGKIILIVQLLPFINAFPNKPIIYNICWKFLIYSFFVLLVQVLDGFIRHFYHTKSWTQTYTYLKMDYSSHLFWGVQVNVLIVFLIFIIFSEMVRVIGKPKMIKIFFG